MGILDAPVTPASIGAVAKSPVRYGIAGTSSKGYTSASGSAASPGITFRSPHKTVNRVTNLRLMFAGWHDGGTNHTEAPLAANMTVKAAIEYNGTTYPVTFGATRSVIIEPWASAISDPLALDLPAGAMFYVRALVITTGAYPTGNPGDVAAVSDGKNGYTASDVVDSVSVMTSLGFNSLWGPTAIFADILGGKEKQLAGVGDSITDGTGDGIWAASYNGGSSWLTRAAAGKVPLIRITSPGMKVSQLTGQLAARRFALLKGCTHAVLFMGTNDNWTGDSLATLQANFLEVAGKLAAQGMKVMAPTMLPRTNSTDGWATAGGQSAASGTPEATRVAFNAWLRAGAPINTSGAAVAIGTSGAALTGAATHPLSKYNGQNVIEAADAIETARDSGIWKGGARTVTDAAMTSGTKTIDSPTAAFTQADKGATISIAGAGAGGATLTTQITGVGSATQAYTVAAASTTVTAASLTVDTWTADGIHPSQRGHVAIAAAFNPDLL